MLSEILEIIDDEIKRARFGAACKKADAMDRKIDEDIDDKKAEKKERKGE